jgi:hypothetical protein
MRCMADVCVLRTIETKSDFTIVASARRSLQRALYADSQSRRLCRRGASLRPRAWQLGRH